MQIHRIPTWIIIFGLCLPLYAVSSESSNQISPNKTVQPDSATLKIQNAKALAISKFGDRIKFDKNGIPIEIEGDLSKGLTETDIVDKAYQFFEINKDIFRLTEPKTELKVYDVHRDDIPVVKMYWAVNGVKVASNLRIVFSKNGSPFYFAGKIDPEARTINTNPAISEDQAKAIVIKDMDKVKDGCPEDAQTEIKNATLIIGRFDEELKLVWGLSVVKCLNGYGYWIDAQTGKILESGSSAIR
jgi:Zn-dependent metalloprotease